MAFLCFFAVLAALLALCAVVYALGAPVHALAVPGAMVASPTSVAGAWQRMHVGGVQLARVTLDAPVEAPLPLLGFSFIVAALLSLFVEHSARSVAPFLARAAGRLLRRAHDGAKEAVRSGPLHRPSSHSLGLLRGRHLYGGVHASLRRSWR